MTFPAWSRNAHMEKLQEQRGIQYELVSRGGSCYQLCEDLKRTADVVCVVCAGSPYEGPCADVVLL